MPHIHNLPNQHDMTVSAYILIKEDDQWKCLVHFHKKMDKLMQIGGHIELDETPWQAVAHEIAEESGFSLDELQILQFTADRVEEAGNLTHPVPVLANTHNVGNEHYHSDMCYAFVAEKRPKHAPAQNESIDLRWMTFDELEEAIKTGDVLRDAVYIYRFIHAHLPLYVRVPASSFSLGKPLHAGVVYKRGAPGLS